MEKLTIQEMKSHADYKLFLAQLKELDAMYLAEDTEAFYRYQLVEWTRLRLQTKYASMMYDFNLKIRRATEEMDMEIKDLSNSLIKLIRTGV